MRRQTPNPKTQLAEILAKLEELTDVKKRIEVLEKDKAERDAKLPRIP